MWSRRAVLATAGVAVAGCAGTSSEPGSDPRTMPATPPGTTYGYTHLRPDGNRVLDGIGDVDGTTPVEVTVDRTPAWVLASADGGASLWTVVTAAGRATTHRVEGGTSERVVDHGAVSTPPIGWVATGLVEVDSPDGTLFRTAERGGETLVEVVHHPADVAEFTHPVPVDGGWLYVAEGGDVVVRRGAETTRFDLDAPADARPVAAGDGRYALYGARTGRYTHGALGDTVEGSSLVVVDPVDERVVTEVRLDAPTVFEGLSPLVADLDGDGDREVVTTVADSTDGARVRAYATDGTELATGPVYGPGWRHQLCVAPFAPDGHPEVAVVRKPHVDRTLEFYCLDGDALTVTATHAGHASHTYGSRNLDGGLAADLDADGRPELLVPTADRTRLEAVRRTADGAETAWRLSLDGELSTNVAGVALDGRVAVGAGTASGVRVWQG